MNRIGTLLKQFFFLVSEFYKNFLKNKVVLNEIFVCGGKLIDPNFEKKPIFLT